MLQHDLIPELKQHCGALTPKLEKLIHVLDWVRIEEFVSDQWQGIGRKPHDRGALTSAFIAKAVLRVSTTAALIERLTMDRSLKRLCGFELWKEVPNEATFSRAFGEFAQAKLAEKVHETMIKNYLGDSLIGHISRDGTAITPREKPKKHVKVVRTEESQKQRRGRTKKDEIRSPKEVKVTQLGWQLTQALPPIISALPKECDRGTKFKSQVQIQTKKPLATVLTPMRDFTGLGIL